VLTKQRPDHNEAEIILLIGDVKGRAAILIDDMIDTAGTLCAGARVVKDAGATRIFAAATHGLLSGGAVERLRASVVVSDTVPLPDGASPDLFQVLSVDRILADSVHNVFCDESVSAIFAGENQLF